MMKRRVTGSDFDFVMYAMIGINLTGVNAMLSAILGCSE
jgi:hypothetical protein